MGVLQLEHAIGDGKSGFKGGAVVVAKGETAGGEVSGGAQIGDHVMSCLGCAEEPVPGTFLQVRIEHLIPSFRIQIVGAEIEAGFAGRLTVAEAREAGAAAERDLADGGRGVAQGKAIAVELRRALAISAGTDSPGTSARTFFNCAVPLTSR